MSARLVDRAAICAVVVTYFPKGGFAENLAAIAPQVGKLVIVDNGSSAEDIAMIQTAAERVGAEVVKLGSNRGIAFALNMGGKIAREHGSPWLATFDQDSTATPEMFKEMAAAYSSYPHPERIAVITPCHVDPRLGMRMGDRSYEALGSGWRVVGLAMTSGNLVNLDAAEAVGGFDDSLFIDSVDHEFCFRLHEHGYQVLEATRAVLHHSLGNLERHWFIYRWVMVTNYPPLRRYYMSRNRLILWRRYWKRRPVWVIRDIRRFLFDLLFVILYEDRPGPKVRMAMHGFSHGIKNVRGAFTPDPPRDATRTDNRP
jgi:rhamnosyltransferase